ncbi:MAG: DUF6319 family protein, partial [Pseudonocardia sp.]|nr:DUF6319 family protein [Pseudonocardia sp.]
AEPAAGPATGGPAASDPAASDPTAPDYAAPDSAAPDSAAAADGAPKRRGRPKGSMARTTRTVELTLTVSGTADGEWQAELKQGASWITQGLPVTAAAVLRAAEELHTELAEPVGAVIGAAREQRAAKVAALEAELQQARKALAEMEE